MSTTPPQQQSRRPSLPQIPIPSTLPSRTAPLTPIGYARNSNHSRRSSISTSLPSSANSLTFPFRRGSISSISSNGRDNDDGAIVEDDDGYIFNPNTAHQRKEEGLSFARRMSFGARALGAVNKGPLSPVGTMGRGFFPDSDNGRNPGLKDHLDGQRRRGMSLGAAQAPPVGLKGVDAAVQGKVKSVATERSIDPFEERIVRGEMYMD